MTSIRKIAEITGLSTATVSRVFNDSSKVSKTSRQKVLKAAEALHYRPNKIAAALRSGKSRIVGVIVPEISNHFFSNIINGIEEQLREEGYNIIIAQSHESCDKERDAMMSFLQLHVEGILLSIAEETTDFSVIEQYKKSGIPIVFFDRTPEMKAVHSVVLDDYKGGFIATEHLIRMGCTHNIHIAGNPKVSIFNRRREGFLAALKKYHQVVFEDSIMMLSFDAERDRLALEQLFQKYPDIDGIFAYGDVHALYVMNLLKSLGVDKALRVKLIGFGNVGFTRHTHPKMSTVDQQCHTMGRLSAALLLKQLKGGGLRCKQHVLTPKLIVRASTLESML